MNKPKLHKAKITELEYVASNTLKITFESKTSFHFRPGQFINMKFPNNVYRSYSISSSPNKYDHFYIVVSVSHSGIGADFFKNVKTNTNIEFIGPSGTFCLSENIPTKIYFFATGTGIAPFISMLYILKNNNSKAKIRLFHGVRSEDKIFFEDKLNSFKNSMQDFNFTICLSKPKNTNFKKNYKKGRITSNFNVNIGENSHFYMCGNPSMIEDTLKILKAKNISENNIFYEKFTRAVSSAG